LEGEHVHALRSRERGCFLVVQTLWAEKIQSTTDAGSLNTFGRNEIEAALISSALLRIACLVILYKTSYQELAADGCNRTGIRTWTLVISCGAVVWFGSSAPTAFASCAVCRRCRMSATACSVSIMSGFTSATLSCPFSQTNWSDAALLITVPGTLALSK